MGLIITGLFLLFKYYLGSLIFYVHTSFSFSLFPLFFFCGYFSVKNVITEEVIEKTHQFSNRILSFQNLNPIKNPFLSFTFTNISKMLLHDLLAKESEETKESIFGFTDMA